MMQIEDKPYRILEKLAKRRSIGVQELIRAVIIPEWRAMYEKTKSSSPTSA